MSKSNIRNLKIRLEIAQSWVINANSEESMALAKYRKAVAKSLGAEREYDHVKGLIAVEEANEAND